MLLTGTFPRTIDDKQRLSIPKRLRDALVKPGVTGSAGDTPSRTAATASGDDGAEETGTEESPALYVAPGTDGSLALYTEESFARLAERLSNSPPTGQDVRAFSRLFYSQAQRLELDRVGRIRIPPELVKLAGLEKDVVLVGVRDHLELWDKARWEAYLTQQQDNYDQLAEKAFAPPQL
jgi:MraZ protein